MRRFGRDSGGFDRYAGLSRHGLDCVLPRLALLPLLLPVLLPLAGCSEHYSPNTYAAAAAQQEATVQRGVIIGVRPVLINANGTVGAVTGGAAGGVAGAQAPGGPVGTAFGAIGGALVGGLAGTAAEQAVADAKGWEYIVQETGGQLVSVTQTSKVLLPIGLHVLVIAGKQQARIVPDYTVQTAETKPTTKTPEPATKGTKPVAKTAPPAANPPGQAATPIYIGPLAPLSGGASSGQLGPSAVGAPPTAASIVINPATPAPTAPNTAASAPTAASPVATAPSAGAPPSGPAGPGTSTAGSSAVGASSQVSAPSATR